MIHSCSECGLQHDHPAGYEAPVSDAVRIAELETKRDVEVARLAKQQDAAWNETRVEVAKVEADAELAAAEGQLEGQLEIIDAITPDDPAEPAPVIDEPEPEPVPEPAPDAPPPPEGQQVRTPHKPSIWPYA